MFNKPNLIRRTAVLTQTGLSKSTLYNRLKDGLFPPPISLGFRAVAFVQSEVDIVISAMIAEQTNDDIKKLVRSLIQQRKQVA